MHKRRVLDLGRIAYLPCWELQRRLAEGVRDGIEPDTLLLVEHEPVLTLGMGFSPESLLLPLEEYARLGIEVHKTDRGGSVTYHGPGQLVLYPIFDIDRHGRDLHRWLRALEETMIRLLAAYGVKGRRFPPHTGVWVGSAKVAAVGIKVRRWVNLHGIALNCDNCLDPFATIVPCGIQGYEVTSLTKLLGREITVNDAKPVAVAAFDEVFGV